MKNNLGLTIDTSKGALAQEVRTPIPISYLSAICTVIGLNYFCWNIGLGSGFWEFVTALLILWTGFVCQGLCMAEMTGALPFTGGTYALARVTLGPWMGFLTGMLEIAQSLLVFVLGVWYLSDIANNHIEGHNNHKLELCIPFVVGFCAFNLWSSHESVYTWVWTVISGVTILVLWLIFVVGSATHADYNKYALHPIESSTEVAASTPAAYYRRLDVSETTTSIKEEHGIEIVSDGISIAVWFFMSLSALPSIVPHMVTPKQEYPKLFLSMPIVTLVVAILTVFLACAQSPGTYGLYNDETIPLSHAYAYIFQLKTYSTRWISFPSLVYTCTVMLRVTTQRVSSLCASGLLPHLTKFIHKLNDVVQYVGVLLHLLPPVPEVDPFLDGADGLLSEESSYYSKGPSTGGHFHPSPALRYAASETPNSTLRMAANRTLGSDSASTTHGNQDMSPPVSLASAPLIAHGGGGGNTGVAGSPHKGGHSSPSHHPMSATGSTALFSISPSMTTGFIGFITYLLCILLRFRGSYSRYSLIMMAVYSTLLVGILTMLTYVQFRKKFDCLETLFTNPGKRYVAVYGGCVFSCAILYTIAKQRHDPRVVIGIVVYVTLCTVYYFYSARRSQCFAEEEQKVMFVAYVINANIKSKLRRQSSMAALRRENSLSMLQRTSSFNSLHTFRSQKTSHSNHNASVHSSHRVASPPSSAASSPSRSSHGTKRLAGGNASTPPQGTSSQLTATSVALDTLVTPPILENDAGEEAAGIVATTSSVDVAATISAPTPLERQDTEVHYPAAAADEPKSTTSATAAVPMMTDSAVERYVTLDDTSRGNGFVDVGLNGGELNNGGLSPPSMPLPSPMNFGREDSTTEKLSTSVVTSDKIDGEHLPLDLSQQKQLEKKAYVSFKPSSIDIMEQSGDNAVSTDRAGSQDLQAHERKRSTTAPSPTASSSRKSQKRGSFISWMFSTMSRPRIYSMTDVEHISRDDEQDTMAPATGDRFENQANSHPERRLSDSLVRAVVQDRVRELGHAVGSGKGSGSSTDSQRNIRKSGSSGKSGKGNGSFSVPQPTKYYRHSLGDVVVIRRRSSSTNSSTAASSTNISFKQQSNQTNNNNHQLRDQWKVEDLPEDDDLRVAAADRFRQGSAISTRQSIPKGVSEEDEPLHSAAALSQKPQRSSSSESRNSGSGKNLLSGWAFLSIKSSSSNKENSAKLSTNVAAVQPDLEAGAVVTDAAAESHLVAYQPTTDAPASRANAAHRSRRSIQGLLRRSMNQISQLASQLLPIADDVTEFQEYTKAFVETMLQDMEQLEAEHESQKSDQNNVLNQQRPHNRNNAPGTSVSVGSGATMEVEEERKANEHLIQNV